MTFVLVGTFIAGLMLGWVAGMWTFRRSLMWCTDCGHTLTCGNCLRRSPATSATRIS